MSGFGFSFLDASHKEDPPASKKRPLSWLGGGQDNQPLASSSSNQDSLYTVGAWAQAPPTASVRQQRTAIEKQADVIGFLKERPDRKPATARDILAGTGIDLEIADVEVKAMLDGNPKVETQDEGGEPAYVYYAKYNVSTKSGLLSLIGRCTSGINMSDLLDTYANAAADLDALVRAGEVIAVKHREHSGVHLYPRGPLFLTKLSSTVTCRAGASRAATTTPLALELKRGEAVRMGDFWTRVSSEVNSTPQPQRAAPPDSVTTDKDLSNKNVYRLRFDPEELSLPLQTPFAPTADTPLTNGSSSSGGVLMKAEAGETVYRGAAVRHGCNQRVRALWRETLLQVPKNDDHALHEMLYKERLTSSKAGIKKRPKMVKQGPGQRESQRSKQKKRVAIALSTKLTNDHLAGTAIGALMEAARLDPEKYNL